MKAIVFLLVVAGIVGAIYLVFIKDSAPYSTYKMFATAVAQGQSEEARRYTDASELTDSSDENRRQTAGGMPVEALDAVRYSHESETKNPDGTVTIQAIQTVRFDPPGATSAMGAMSAKYRQTAVLRKSGDQWKVTSIKSEFLEMLNWKGEKQ